MSARKITVSVECCDADSGEMAIGVQDPAHPDRDLVYQEIQLHPAVCSLLHDLLGIYVSQGIGTIKSLTLNDPEVTP